MTNSLPNELLNKIEAKRRELQAAQKAFQAELQASIGGIFENFFAAHPDVEIISWRQYTPYFNDGEACEFGVYEPEFFFEGEWDENERYNEGHSSWSFSRGAETDSRFSAQLKADWNGISDLIQGDEDSMLAIFGDHVTVTVTRDGITVDEYDHD